jgi:hypothetical protein
LLCAGYVAATLNALPIQSRKVLAMRYGTLHMLEPDVLQLALGQLYQATLAAGYKSRQ